MRARAALVLVGAALVGCGGGDEPAEPEEARLEAADARLADRPGDPRALADVLRAAYAGVQANADPETGEYDDEARIFAERAAAVWPRYVDATRRRPAVDVANVMSLVYEQRLDRPREAAEALRYAVEARPSPGGYARLVLLYTRAGDRRSADRAARRTIALTPPDRRHEMREYIRRVRDQSVAGR